MPGAGLLQILSSGLTPYRPGIDYEVLIAGSNDLVVGDQRNIYIVSWRLISLPDRPILNLFSTLCRHDLEPDHSIHSETVLAFHEGRSTSLNGGQNDTGGDDSVEPRTCETHPQQSPRQQHATYAEALRGSPTPGNAETSKYSKFSTEKNKIVSPECPNGNKQN
ncbi:hypothetical protein J6590_040468 [Homalodisca vitripennis]|nr:hypothetical protein J6590_099079 [Homalodisca vitripennis]KAG8282236.1 hypothetical protein J6590_040468 [Homalodisca vitripennis]